MFYVTFSRESNQRRGVLRFTPPPTTPHKCGMLRPLQITENLNLALLAGKFSKCNDAFIEFSVPEEVCMFAFALFAQMFACKISCLIGNNPDEPRALTKVTITK